MNTYILMLHFFSHKWVYCFEKREVLAVETMKIIYSGM